MAKKKTFIGQIDALHQTPQGYAVFAIVEFALAYLFMSLAIDHGQLWQYLIGIILFIGAVSNLVKLIKRIISKK